MMKKGFAICEFYYSTNTHQEFIAGLIKLTAETFPDYDLHFFSRKSNLVSVLGRLNSINIKNVSYHPIHPLSQEGGIRQNLNELKGFIGFHRALKNFNYSFILFCSSSYTHLKWIKLLAARNKCKRIGVVLNIPEEELLKPDKQTLKRRLFEAIFSPEEPKNLFYFVFADYIRKRTLQQFPHMEKSLYAIEHPVLTDRKIQDTYLNRNEIFFAFLGNVSIHKGFNLFREIVEEKDNWENGEKGKFILVGCIKDPKINIPKTIEVFNEGKFIDRGLFGDLCQKTHYALLLHDTKAYQNRPMGTLFDAIAYGIPIIGLTNPFLKYYFDKFEDIGYLCDSLDDVKQVIRDILSNPPKDRYSHQQKCLQNAREKLSLENQLSKFRKLWTVE